MNMHTSAPGTAEDEAAEDIVCEGIRQGNDGISLRDWLAAQAMATAAAAGDARAWEIIGYFGKHATGITRAQIIAARSYEIADAMISESRRKRER